MRREDFSNNVDWVVYKVTGRLPNDKDELELDKHSLPNGKNELKFYYNGNTGRYGVLYHNKFICACSKEDIGEVQTIFDDEFNGKNLKNVSLNLRKRYNKVRRYQTYKDGNLRFSERDGRLTATITDNKKKHTICSCYPNQKDEVIAKYNSLKETRDLETIKSVMKSQYNIQGRKPSTSYDGNTISICQNGTIYKNGKFCKADPQLYEYISKFI